MKRRKREVKEKGASANFRAGDTIGLWTLVRPTRKVGSTGINKTAWECRCICGTTKTVRTSQLAADGVTGCVACLGKSKRKPVRPVPIYYWNRLLHNSRNRSDVAVSITHEEIEALWLLQNGRCALSGLPIAFATPTVAAKKTTASLDRIDSSRGYVLGNCQWVHKNVNLMKSNLSQAVFIELCCAVADHSRANVRP